MVALDEHARFLWVQIHRSGPLLRDSYIVVCYFPQPHHTVHFIGSLRGPHSLTSMLTSPIIEEVILMGDFIACTRNLHVFIHD